MGTGSNTTLTIPLKPCVVCLAPIPFHFLPQRHYSPESLSFICFLVLLLYRRYLVFACFFLKIYINESA